MGKAGFTLRELAEVLQARLEGDPARVVVGVAPLDSAGPDQISFLTDARLKTTYLLPGQPSMATRFKIDGRKLVIDIEGNKIIAGMNQIFVLDAAELRKVYRSKEKMDALTESVFGVFPDDSAKAVIAKPSGPQFDYAKEVKEARAAYPELRKKLNLGDDIKLPGADAPAPKPK